MKAFVTGATGHVGGNLVRELLDRDYDVKCLVRSDTRAIDGLNVEYVKANLLKRDELKPLMEDCDVVFHSAAFVAVEKVKEDLMWKINVEGTQAVCDAAIDSNVSKLIHFSSVHAFNQHPTSEPLTEERPLVTDPKAAPYDRTKAASQEIVYETNNRGLPSNIIHPTGIIGPFDYKPSRMGQVIINIAKGRMPFTLNTGFNWVDVRDVCHTAVNCVELGRPGQNYLTPGSWGSMKEISDYVSKEMGEKKSFVNAPFWTAYLALPFAGIKSKITGKRPSFSKGSLHALAVQCKEIPGSLAKNDLDHSPRDLEETIRDTTRWLIDSSLVRD